MQSLQERDAKSIKTDERTVQCTKNVWTVAKNSYEKGLTYAYRDRKTKNVSLDRYGLCVSMPLLMSTV